MNGMFLACSKHIYPGGPQLIEKAKEITERLGKSNFKGSRGWLEKWKLRYNIKQVKICGESGDVHGETIDSWKEKLFGIWTRPACFGKHFLTVDLGVKDDNVREGRKVSKG